MKLHFHPVSTTSRPIMLFAADEGIALEYQVVDLFTGEHLKAPFAQLNPSQQVPVLEDGAFVLTESSAIIRYLAEKTGSAAYPTDLRQRARVNERLDWLITGLARDLLYGFCYPQSMGHHKRQDDATHTNTIAWGRQNARRWLGVLDEQMIGPHHDYLCGDAITLADYIGAGILSHGEVEQVDFSHWRNVTRWLETMRARPNWAKVHEPFQQYWVQPCAANTYEPI